MKVRWVEAFNCRSGKDGRSLVRQKIACSLAPRSLQPRARHTLTTNNFTDRGPSTIVAPPCAVAKQNVMSISTSNSIDPHFLSFSEVRVTNKLVQGSVHQLAPVSTCVTYSIFVQWGFLVPARVTSIFLHTVKHLLASYLMYPLTVNQMFVVNRFFENLLHVKYKIQNSFLSSKIISIINIPWLEIEQ